MLPLQGTWVQSLLRELRSCQPHGMAKKRDKDATDFPVVETTDSTWCELFYSQGKYPFSSVQFISVAQSCLTLCDPMNRSTPGLPVHHQFLEFTQTHVHRIGDAIQPSHPLLSPSPPAPNPSQHQGLFQ